jgi:hypothetical protein
VTVEFKDAYEQHVLEALLRGVSGYIVGPRQIAGAASASGFDRIVILATSNAPRPAPVTPAVSRPPGPQPIRRLPAPIDDVTDDTVDDSDAAVAIPGARPETPADLRRRLGQILEAEPDDDDAEPAAPPTTPANPFGVTSGASRPGVITPVPAARPGQPRTTPPPATQP